MTFSIEAVKAIIRKNKAKSNGEVYPAVKLYIPETRHVWLLSELFCEDRNIALGLFIFHGCVITQGFIDLNELTTYEPVPGKQVEFDKNFKAKYPLRIYEAASKLCLYITDNGELLPQY